MARATSVQREDTSELSAPVAFAGYLLVGTLFGILAVKSQIISWYRIQEMFRFDSFHMYGIFATAIPVAALSVWLIKRLEATSLTGQRITLSPKDGQYRARIFGGTLFGFGWALTGACPGPILVLVGAGIEGYLVVLASAVVGTWCYGNWRSRLPH